MYLMAVTKEKRVAYRRSIRECSDVDGATSEGTSTHNWFVNNFVTHDGPVKDYWKLIAAGQCATSNLQGVKFEYHESPGVIYFLQNYVGPSPTFTPRKLSYVADGVFFGPFTVNHTLDTTKARDQAIVRYFQKADQVQTKLQGMVVLGELRETLRMIKSPAQTIRRGLDSYLSHITKYGSRVPKNRRPKFVADSWLEYSFGWKPLLDDIDSAAKALATGFFETDFEFISATGVSNDYADLGQHQYTWGPIVVYSRSRMDEEAFVRFYGAVNREVDSPQYLQPANYGFKPEAFIPTVWELIPYSFLVDYFTNIGDVLFAWSFHTSNLRWTSQLTRRVCKSTTYDPSWKTSSLPQTGFVKTQYAVPSSVRWSKTTVTRTRDASVHVPTLHFEIPGFSSLKWLNLAALGRNHTRARQSLR
jgi:hypothetical protein